MRKCKYSKYGTCRNEKKETCNCFGDWRARKANKCPDSWTREFDEDDNIIPVTQLEQLKKDIAGIKSGAEMVGYLNGLEAAAVIWCKKNDPDNLYQTPSGETKVAICGMAAYLESIIE